GSGAAFHWQHCAGAHGPDILTVFDNGVRQEKRSRALVLTLDTNAMHVDLTHAYAHPSGADAGVLGSAQLLPNGDMFVGWGTLPYFSQFTADSTLTLDGEMPIGVRSYRAFTQDWAGHPTDRPRFVSHAIPA